MSKNKKLAQVFHYDLQGKRDEKYEFLNKNSLNTIEWNILEPNEPNYFLVKKDFDQSGMYEKGFKIDKVFNLLGPGVETGLDRIFISDYKKELKKTFENISLKTDEVFRLLKIENKTSYLVKDKLKVENYMNIADDIVLY